MKTVAVISVDPSRRRSGGALLGDRIRMNAIGSPDDDRAAGALDPLDGLAAIADREVDHPVRRQRTHLIGELHHLIGGDDLRQLIFQPEAFA